MLKERRRSTLRRHRSIQRRQNPQSPSYQTQMERLAQQHMNKLAGNAFNIGGGTANSISLLELLDLLAELHGGDLSVRFEDWRAADQRYYVADTSKFSGLTGWQPRVGVHEGVRRLYEWIKTGDEHFTAEPVGVTNVANVRSSRSQYHLR